MVKIQQIMPNMTLVDIGTLSLYFSYKTVIAFSSPNGLRIRTNVWGPTTGKHLNYLSADKTRRIEGSAFEKELAETLCTLGLTRIA
jgi:hypothetical protein